MEAYIIGTGVSIPERTISNEELSPQLGFDPDFIFNRSGIKNRRWVGPGIKTSDLASDSLCRALEDAGKNGSDLDYIIFGTMTPDRFIPGCATAVQTQVGLPSVPCLDIRAACCNALYGLQISKALIENSTAQIIALCLAEIQSSFLDLSPESGTISMLFGDGASTLVVSREANEGALRVVDILLESDGAYINSLGIHSPGTEFRSEHIPQKIAANNIPQMEGRIVILHSLRKTGEACLKILERNNLTVADLSWIVPHQANANLLRELARNLGFPEERVVSVLPEFGNTSSASIGIALDTLRKSTKLESRNLILIPAFAAGFTWGAALCEIT